MERKRYELTSRQVANIILAARNDGKCKKAKEFVKHLDDKYKLKGNRR